MCEWSPLRLRDTAFSFSVYLVLLLVLVLVFLSVVYTRRVVVGTKVGGGSVYEGAFFIVVSRFGFFAFGFADPDAEEEPDDPVHEEEPAEAAMLKLSVSFSMARLAYAFGEMLMFGSSGCCWLL